MIFKGQHDACLFGIVQTFTPVSYTHLDVYKRQPLTYRLYVANTAVNLSIFYLQSIPNKQKSLAYAKEALTLALPYIQQLGLAQQIVSTVRQIVQAWSEDSEEFFKNLN